MAAKTTNQQRDRLIEVGARVFHERGYVATGVRQIAEAAGVPQGSFTNHYRSKDAFGIAALAHYAGRLDAVMARTLSDEMMHPSQRLNAYFDAIETAVAGANWQVGCLVPDLAAEASTYSDELRQALLGVLERQSSLFADVVGELVGNEDADDLAAVLLAAWHGSLLRMKVERTARPLLRFRKVLNRMIEGARGAGHIRFASPHRSS